MTDTMEPNSTLTHLVADLKEQEALAVVRARLAAGDNPLAIVEACQMGLQIVGERYEQQIYFLAGLIMAGEIFRQVMELLQPTIEEEFKGNESGTILLGTVRGDIHDIGKNSLSMLLNSYGFTVHDLGVDVAPVEFLLAAIQVKPDIIGLSGLITSSFEAMKETIHLIRVSGESEVSALPIIIGGYMLTEQVSMYVKADYWVNDAMSGVRICQQLLAEP
jgi:methanogenic corrinoid protein MtbC1